MFEHLLLLGWARSLCGFVTPKSSCCMCTPAHFIFRLEGIADFSLCTNYLFPVWSNPSRCSSHQKWKISVIQMQLKRGVTYFNMSLIKYSQQSWWSILCCNVVKWPTRKGNLSSMKCQCTTDSLRGHFSISSGASYTTD